MSRKSYGMMILTLMLIALDWGTIGNFNLTRMQAVAASCKHLGQISKIQNGSVERKQSKGQWEKIVSNTELCQGDILRTKSNRGKQVTIKIKCTGADYAERSIPANQITGVNNVCSRSIANFSRMRQRGGAGR
ncbi:hypothetical protein GNF10_32505 [Nostoc sp. UCD121]|uniref:hypothetical protein n=1 Tax=unclassified Nostoc TaxID=2593658 RepID=UPI00162586C7|nr:MULTISPECIES: hypothetical protein [unclassified Nostoc]MBC1225401.1 hypothetical protein [Nostoc sp. UCD120]MBC1280536.1 hypothetical protein [Nostoc sp. UCD121]